MNDGGENAATPVSLPFWLAAAKGELVLQQCEGCGGRVWYPRAICPTCGSTDLEWRAASDLGTVYAVSVHHRPARPELADVVPYAVALVDLDEGVRMMARVAADDAGAVAIGDRVRWRPAPDGGRAFVFEPA